MKYETGKYINGQQIILGDKLQSPETYEVVVMYDKEWDNYFVQTIEKPNVVFALDKFLADWKYIKKTGSIITR